MKSWLSGTGALAAGAVGIAVTAGTGWRGLTVLLAFFVTSSLLTPGGGRRGAIQVLANGGLAALCALLALADRRWCVGFAGALAAAASDTWSTEIGARSHAAPRLITTWRPVARGTSGGVTALGTLAGLAGAALIAITARAAGLIDAPMTWWVTLGGVSGGVADSLLGATVQVRCRCPVCGAVTEQPEHGCAGTGLPAFGISFITNDAVNFLATLVGASVAALPVLAGRAGLP